MGWHTPSIICGKCRIKPKLLNFNFNTDGVKLDLVCTKCGQALVQYYKLDGLRDWALMLEADATSKLPPIIEDDALLRELNRIVRQ